MAPPPVLSRRLGILNTDEATERRLTERHFIEKIPGALGQKRKNPSRVCVVCNNIEGIQMKIKCSSYWCAECRKVTCVGKCFYIYHNFIDYKCEAARYRGNVCVVQDPSVLENDENSLQM